MEERQMKPSYRDKNLPVVAVVADAVGVHDLS